MNRRDFLKRISSAVPVIIGAGLLSFEEDFIEEDWYRGTKYDFSGGEIMITGTILPFEDAIWEDMK